MRIWTLAATAMVLGTLSASPIARSEDAAPKAAAEAKPIEVRICPISNTPVKGEGAGNRMVKNYKAFFC